MKKLIIFCLMLFWSCSAWAYDPLYESDLANAPTDIGTVAAIFNCSDVAGSAIGRWKSVAVTASASGTVTHFLIPIAETSFGNQPVGFAVYADNAGEPASTPTARGYYASYSFGSGAGWYALPFTTPTTFSVTSGTMYHLVYLLDKEENYSAGVRGTNNCVPPSGEWIKRGSQCNGVACSYDAPPGVSGETWDVTYLANSGPWEMGILIAEEEILGYPNSISATGTWNHKLSKIITGLEFGTKSPAEPLNWDDCEDRTLETPSAVTSEGGWDERLPSTAPATYNMQYRAGTYRDIPQPHSRSNNYMVGGCYNSANPENNVLVTADTGSSSNKWYATWRVRLDNNFPGTWQSGDGSNYKAWAWQANSTYTGESGTFAYWARADGGVFAGDDLIDHTSQVALCGTTVSEFSNVPSEGKAWRHYEFIGRKNPGYTLMTQDGISYGADTCDGDAYSFVLRSFSIGGWTRAYMDGSVHNEMFRYFDDLYVDTTWSRVMLCNDDDYDEATICEPQIPEAWDVDEITVTVNLGALTGETAYLFVFDSDNDANPTGYEVTLGESTTPTPPSGMMVKSGPFK